MTRNGLRKKVLVVDDDAFIRALLRTWLQEAGYSVVTAGDGQQALEQVEREKPDIVLLDLMMPTLDGYAVIRWLRRCESTRRLPIIVLSADMRAHQKLEGAGVNGLISKPFDLEEVLHRVNEHVPLRRVDTRTAAKA